MFRNALALVAAASMASAPALASPAAAPTAPAAAVDRTGATADGSALRGGSLFAPALAALIVLLGVLTATGVIFDDDDRPVSP